MKKFAEFKATDQRLIILRLLDEGGPSANDSVLHKSLKAAGHTDLMRPEVQDLIRWLESKQAVTVQVEDTFTGAFLVATITMFGRFVARGKEKLDGVAVPGEV